MMDLLRLAGRDIANFLEPCLKAVSEDWWNSCVIDRLSFQQQRFVVERGHRSLDDFDFAALIRLFDQNWFHIRQTVSLPPDARSWVKELRGVRNKWAHLASTDLSPDETYRDLDSLERFLKAIGSNEDMISRVQEAKQNTLLKLSATNNSVAKANVLAEPSTTPDLKDVSIASSQSPKFSAGDLVRLKADLNVLLPILTVDKDGPEPQYAVFHEDEKQTYFESQLTADDEAERSSNSTAKELRGLITSSTILSPSTANLFSMKAGRVNFVPYQYRPVLKLVRADRPRLLIADEVGVGKTIEAGLIIKELEARMDLYSILIICPKALVSERKWFSEMKRFDERFTALDGPQLRHCLRETHLEGEWPRQYAKAIVPFSLFDSTFVYGPEGRKQIDNKGLLELDPPPQFDLVIVDEAHHIRNPDTYLHQGIKFICDHAQAAILLSATPVQMGREDLFTLLNVIRPDLILDQTSFEQMAAPNRYIHSAGTHCRNAQRDWRSAARDDLIAAANTEWGQLFIRETPEFQSIYDKLSESELAPEDRVSMIAKIEELYTFGHLINRTRRRDIGEFTIRRAETVSIEFTPTQRHLHDELLDVIARILIHCHGSQNVKFMMTTIRRQSASCLFGLAPLLSDMLNGKIDQLDWLAATDTDTEVSLDFVKDVRTDIDKIVELANTIDDEDPKVDAFLDILSRKTAQKKNKVLVFSTFRHTLAYLHTHVRDSGLRVGLIHGGIPDVERANIRRCFALDKDDPDALDILLSSEVGCEGLDFQFCDFMVNYDLPWNPMKIEQRIGRIDRYGQKSEAVSIMNFVTPGTVDADIYDRCLLRIGVFQSALGGSEEILGEIAKELNRIGENIALSEGERAAKLQQLSDNVIRDVLEEEALENKQSELFGLNFPGQSWQNEIEEAETSWLSPESLERIVIMYLQSINDDEMGGLSGEKSVKTIRLSREHKTFLLRDYDKVRKPPTPPGRDWEKWLKNTESRLSVTFDQSTALENPDITHLSVIHPLVRQAAIYCRRSESIDCTLTVSTSKFPQGNYPFSIYAWSKSGVRNDETLIPITKDPRLSTILLELIEEAKDGQSDNKLSGPDRSRLEEMHHRHWNNARAEHMETNQTFADQRSQSLTVSHRARIKILEEQIEKANNSKIHLMKTSERDRAEADYLRRLDALKELSTQADIRFQLLVNGVITINMVG